MATYTPSSDNVTFGRGKVLFSEFVSGAYTGQFRHLGNCDTFSIGLSPEKISLTDFTTETSSPYKELKAGVGLPAQERPVPDTPHQECAPACRGGQRRGCPGPA